MKTILATAYAINPYKGSEDGMGWNFVCQIARFNRVIAVTRRNNRQHIERYQAEHPNPDYERMSFLYYDLPYWMRFWKKGGRGAMLYYLMWQYGITGFIRRQAVDFDIAHNVNFHNDWTPSYLWKLGKPFVWGPVGHHPQIAARFMRGYPAAARLKEKLTWWIKQYFWRVSPALRRTAQKADHILCMNSEALRVLGAKGKKQSIMPSVASEDFGFSPKPGGGPFTLISAGRLVALKGFDLAIEAYGRFLAGLPETARQQCRLIIVGSGPGAKKYRELTERLGATAHIQFVEWLPREELMRLYRTASAFLFPSHEGAGMVVSEALSFGLPVLCLDNAGPGEFITPACGIAVHADTRTQTIEQLANAIARLHHNEPLRRQMAAAARQRFENAFHWNRRGEALHQIYETLSL